LASNGAFSRHEKGANGAFTVSPRTARSREKGANERRVLVERRSASNGALSSLGAFSTLGPLP
jgi:hypothetical protein